MATTPTARIALCFALSWASIAPAAGPGASAGKLMPAKGLAAYLEFDGLDAHAGAWRGTAARAMLAGTPAGSMINELTRQLADGALKLVPGARLEGADLVGFQDDLIRSGFAIGVYQEAEGGPCFTLAFPGLGRPGPRERFERLARFCYDPAGAELPAPIRVRGRDLRQIVGAGRPWPPQGAFIPPVVEDQPRAEGPSLTWWFEGDDLILVDGPASSPKGHEGRVAGTLDAIERKGGDASTHPGYLAALAEGGDLPGFEADGLFFIEAEAVEGMSGAFGGAFPGPLGGLKLPTAPSLPDDLKFLDPAQAGAPKRVEAARAAQQADDRMPAAPEAPDGPSALGRVLGRWGFQGKALVTDIRVEAPRPRKGALAALDRPALRKDQLPPIPKRAASFGVGTWEPLKAADRVEALLGGFAPGAAGIKAQVDDGLRDFLGLKLREDVLARLGTTWAFCSIPAEPKPGDGPTPPGLGDLAVLAALDDADGFARGLDAAAARFNARIRELEAAGGKPGGAPVDDAPILALEPLPAPARGCQLTSPAGLVPWLGDGVRPTIRVGRGYLALALDPEVAGDALAAESDPEARWRPTGELAGAFGGLPGTLTLLCVGDPGRGSWTSTLPSLPVVSQTLVGMVGAFGGEGTPGDLLGLVGVPRPGGFRLRIPRSMVPKWDELRAHLFPSLLAASVDDRGLRLIGREAFPLAPFGDEDSLDTSISWNSTGGVKQEFKFKVKRRVGR